MSIEMYKQANEELIKKVQELKLEIHSIQAELLVANKNFFDERERRLEIEQTFNQLLKQAKRQMANVFEQMFENFDNISNLQLNSSTPPSTKSRKSSTHMRRRSSMCIGVTVRSPVKSTTTTTTTAFAGNMNNDLYQQTAIVEETTDNANSPYIKSNKNLFGLKNFTEESENLMSSVENSKNVTEPTNSYRSVVDMGATADGEREESEPVALRTIVPRLLLNDRRATHIFSHAISPEKQCSTTSKQAVASPNNSCNANASANIDQLTADFSDNLQLHSTPRTSSSIDESDATQTTLSLSSLRPRRQCAPKKLAELPLNKKLRNESDSKRSVKKGKKQK